MSKGANDRVDRVAEQIRAELMEMLLRGELRDPGARSALISGVRLSPDLRHARIYLRLLEAEVSDGQKERLVRAMGRAAPFLRRKLAARMKLRYVPELRFYWDEQQDQAVRIEGLLAEIREEGGEG